MPPSLGGVAGGPRGGGVALPRSVTLSRGGRHQSACHWRCSIHGGRGLHTVPARVSVLTPDAVRGLPLRTSPGLPACRGHCGSGRVVVWGLVVYAPNGAPPRVPQPSRGGASPGLAGGVKG